MADKILLSASTDLFEISQSIHQIFVGVKMDIAEASELFWLIIERDIIDVPLHIKNAFT